MEEGFGVGKYECIIVIHMYENVTIKQTFLTLAKK